jgi:alpha-tubulin suppressor-like RCC1 family protein
VAIAAGTYHTCALLNDASLKCWGGNVSGQLGLGDTTNRGDGAGEMGDSLPPVSLGAGKTTVALAAGTNHTCALLNDASLKCWGSNGSGQLGLGVSTDHGDGAGEMGDNLYAITLGAGKTAVALAVGYYHTCALLNDASLKCWGQNDFGQLGIGDTDHRGVNPGEMGDALPIVKLFSDFW